MNFVYCLRIGVNIVRLFVVFLCLHILHICYTHLQYYVVNITNFFLSKTFLSSLYSNKIYFSEWMTDIVL